jgi:hypothetical protein
MNECEMSFFWAPLRVDDGNRGYRLVEFDGGLLKAPKAVSSAGVIICANRIWIAMVAEVAQHFLQTMIPIMIAKIVALIMAAGDVKNQWSDGNGLFRMSSLWRILFVSNSP